MKDLLASAQVEVEKGIKYMCNRWEGVMKMISAELSGLHPPSKVWKIVLAEPDKEQMISMTKNDSIISVGKLTPKNKKYRMALDEFCGQSFSTSIRNWWSKADQEGKHGCIAHMDDALVQAKLALAVATIIKAIHVKGPKAKDTPHLLLSCELF